MTESNTAEAASITQPPLNDEERKELEAFRVGEEDEGLQKELQLGFDKRYAVELITKLRGLDPLVHECGIVQTMFTNMLSEAMEQNMVCHDDGDHYCSSLPNIVVHHLRKKNILHPVCNDVDGVLVPVPNQ